MAGVIPFVDAAVDAQFLSDLEAGLLADLRSESVQGVNRQIRLARRGADGALRAGLAGATSYGWLRINMIWVRADVRGTGLGRELMHEAISIARTCGCHSSWLETSSPQARAFYERLGFEVFGALHNTKQTPPEQHSRWFLKLGL